MYKDAAPLQTIECIKQILNTLGIKTRETLYNKDDLCYSCRIAIDSHGLESLDIGTNGKGMSPEYSLASGYAELMERLQNKFLVNEAMRHAGKIPNGVKLPFRFFPDEKLNHCSVEAFFVMMKKFFPNYHCEREEVYRKELITILKEHGNSWNWQYKQMVPSMEFLAVPFANIGLTESKIEYIPIVLARANSSTGLCAGNTPEEAITQGINEIFERYVLQQIYLNKITPPPPYPENYFHHTTIGMRLEQLKKSGYSYDVKDMSLGKGFPVVGLILKNNVEGTMMFRLGADLNEEIALERCFTEIFQGRTKDELHFLKYSAEIWERLRTDTTFRNSEYRKSLKDGTGYYPHEIFDGGQPYSFEIFDGGQPYSFLTLTMGRSGNSHTDFLTMLLFLRQNGYELFIRDNSFLGFCAYQIIIPGLSEQDYRLNDIFEDYIETFFKIDDTHLNDLLGTVKECNDQTWPLYNIKANSDLRNFLEKRYSDDEEIRLAPYCSSPQNYIEKNLLMFLFDIKRNDYASAQRHFSFFLNKRAKLGLPEDAYLLCVERYIDLKSKKITDARQIKKEIIEKTNISHSIVEEVMADFRKPSEIMKNYSFPTCFDCCQCPQKLNCHFCDAIGFERLIQLVQSANPVDQNKLFELVK